MSLLLDALKKAADDKKKNLAPDEPADNADNTDDSLELDLDLDSTTDAGPNNDDFPQVDKSSVSQAIIDEPLSDISLDESSIKNEHAKLPENATTQDSTKDNPIEFVDKDSVKVPVEEDNEIIKSPSTSTEPVNNDIKNANDTPVNKDSTANEKVSIKRQPPIIEPQQNVAKNIATEEALSALINKSNKYSKQENFKKTITIIILVTLLLVGSGLFFYIKMDSASQSIFIAHNNQAPVSRSLEPSKLNTQAVAQKPENIVEKKSITKKATLNKKPLPAQASKKPQTIHIVHAEKKDPISTLILEAYNQFHRGDYEQANNLYNQVVLREPTNRDALLGLSAIAIKQQRYEFARQKYQYLLHLNPKDSIAIAGISSIENTIDPLQNESQLIFMLKEQPDAAHLYFALGSLYSSQNKWPEAQSAYFSAWSAENKNADYAYNLAISLDHLEKKNQALEFYTLSLKLKQASSGNFSADNTLQRIHTLKESKE